MRAGSILSVALVAWLATVYPCPAQEEAWAMFVSPPPGQPTVGQVNLVAEVAAPDIYQVVFLADGREVGRLTSPPWELTVDLGDGMGAHFFEVRVLNRLGVILARGTRETPPLQVDEQVDLELVQLYVTVERNGRTYPGLGSADFEILDRGVPQQIVTFEGGDAALAVALLVDASESMQGGRLQAALEGTRAFVSQMQELDEAAVYLFSDSLRSRSSFGTSAEPLRLEDDTVRAAGGTALNDTLFLSLRELEARQGRRVVILLSDGVDVHSSLRMAEVLWAAKRCRSLVYWIELRLPGTSSSVVSHWKSAAEHREELELLRHMTRETGGRTVPIDTVGQAADAFREILGELRSQYVLGYYPSVDLNDGVWHEVEVRTPRRALEMRARGGYYDQ